MRVTYSKAMDRVRIIFDDRTIYVVPRRLLEGLESASIDELKRIEIVEDGPKLRWAMLEVTHGVPDLLKGVYGGKQWMARVERVPAESKRGLFDTDRKKAGARLRRYLEEPVIMTNAQASGGGRQRRVENR